MVVLLYNNVDEEIFFYNGEITLIPFSIMLVDLIIDFNMMAIFNLSEDF
ncbi:hypothetical protein [Methanobrevibacter sp.]|nr:hypothetical protein [Methanobrevibacter sp.]MEE0024825.1 hypothetical protein [Methanobrevibacter sp.]